MTQSNITDTNKAATSTSGKSNDNNALGSLSQHFRESLIGQIVVASSPFQSNNKDISVTIDVDAAIDIMNSFEPRDEIEAMLIAQLISAHNSAMYCLAKLPDLSFEQRNDYFNYSNKFMRTYATLLESLHKHRNRGQSEQKITVQYVQVNDGGQAIVGTINQS